MEDTDTHTDSQDGRHRHRIEDTYSQDGRHRQLGWKTVSQDGRHRQSEWKTQTDRMEDTDSQDGRHRNRHTVAMEDTHSQDGKHKHRHSGLKTRAQTDSQDRRCTQNVRIEDTDKKLGWKTQSWD